MHLIEVTDKRTSREFILVNVVINKNDPHYIRPLDKDVMEVFDKSKNKAFRFGEVKRWILKDDHGNLVGRIAAIANKKYKNLGDEQTTAGIGFFDCIDNQEAANLLFDSAKTWLHNMGYEAMDGPVNFGERDKWWGLLVEGFEPPNYCMNYNPPYYQQLFENYGFKVFFNQLCFGRSLENDLPERFYEGHAKVAADKNFSARRFEKKLLDKYAVDFAAIYNKAFAGHGGSKQMDIKIAKKLFQQMSPVIDEDIAWFVYYGEEPVAFYINLPDLNQLFKFLDGRFNLLAKLKFLWLKHKRIADRMIGILFAVIPEYQKKGVDYYMVTEAYKVMRARTKYKTTELQWIGDFNPKMINIAHNLEFTQSRRLITYRYLFDREAEFKRHPILS